MLPSVQSTPQITSSSTLPPASVRSATTKGLISMLVVGIALFLNRRLSKDFCRFYLYSHTPLIRTAVSLLIFAIHGLILTGRYLRLPTRISQIFNIVVTIAFTSSLILFCYDYVLMGRDSSTNLSSLHTYSGSRWPMWTLFVAIMIFVLLFYLWKSSRSSSLLVSKHWMENLLLWALASGLIGLSFSGISFPSSISLNSLFFLSAAFLGIFFALSEKLLIFPYSLSMYNSRLLWYGVWMSILPLILIVQNFAFLSSNIYLRKEYLQKSRTLTLALYSGINILIGLSNQVHLSKSADQPQVSTSKTKSKDITSHSQSVIVGNISAIIGFILGVVVYKLYIGGNSSFAVFVLSPILRFISPFSLNPFSYAAPSTGRTALSTQASPSKYYIMTVAVQIALFVQTVWYIAFNDVFCVFQSELCDVTHSAHYYLLEDPNTSFIGGLAWWIKLLLHLVLLLSTVPANFRIMRFLENTKNREDFGAVMPWLWVGPLNIITLLLSNVASLSFLAAIGLFGSIVCPAYYAFSIHNKSSSKFNTKSSYQYS